MDGKAVAAHVRDRRRMPPFSPAMSEAEWLALERSGGPLSPAQIAEGWHYCHDWDGLLIGPGWPEMACCTCPP